MKHQHNLRVATTATLATVLLLTSGGSVFAFDNGLSTSKHSKIAKVVLTPEQRAILEAKLILAKTSAEAAQVKAKATREALKTIKDSLEPDFKIAMEAAIVAAKTAAGIVTPDPVAVTAAENSALAAKAALEIALTNVKTAEIALKADPTNVILQTALTSAKTALVSAQAIAQSTRATLESLVGKDKPKVKLDIKAIRVTVEAAFLVLHPTLATAIAADKASYDALKIAKAAVKVAQEALRPNRSGMGKGKMGKSEMGMDSSNKDHGNMGDRLP